MVFSTIVILALALELLLIAPKSRAGTAAGAIFRRSAVAVPAGVGLAALGALVVVFALELGLIWRAVHTLFAAKPWIAQLPIPVMWVYPVDLVPQSLRTAFAALSVLEAALVGMFLLAFAQRPWRRRDTIAAAGAACAIVVLALLAPAMTSADMYAYVGDGLLGPSGAYAPPATALPGEFAQIHHMWRLPLLPAAYGPLWLWWNSAILALAGTLAAKLLVLRLVNVAALAIILAALRSLGVAPALIAATAANPAIAFYFIANGHNDLLVIAIVLVAMVFAGRFPVGAGVVAGIGASLKLTLVVPAAAVALTLAALPRRLTYVAVMLVTAAAIGLVLGGKPYLHALSAVSIHYSGANRSARIFIPHAIVAVVTVGLTLLAVWTRRTYTTAAFGFAALAQAFYPWYAIWGLPYAVARANILTAFLIGFPIVTVVLDNEIRSAIIGPLVIVALLVAIGCALAQRGAPRAGIIEV